MDRIIHKTPYLPQGPVTDRVTSTKTEVKNKKKFDVSRHVYGLLLLLLLLPIFPSSSVWDLLNFLSSVCLLLLKDLHWTPNELSQSRLRAVVRKEKTFPVPVILPFLPLLCLTYLLILTLLCGKEIKWTTPKSPLLNFRREWWFPIIKGNPTKGEVEW